MQCSLCSGSPGSSQWDSVSSVCMNSLEGPEVKLDSVSEAMVVGYSCKRGAVQGLRECRQVVNPRVMVQRFKNLEDALLTKGSSNFLSCRGPCATPNFPRRLRRTKPRAENTESLQQFDALGL